MVIATLLTSVAFWFGIASFGMFLERNLKNGFGYSMLTAGSMTALCTYVFSAANPIGVVLWFLMFMGISVFTIGKKVKESYKK